MADVKNQKVAAVWVTLRGIWRHLSGRRKKQLYLLSGLTLMGGLAEAVSLSLVVPFLAAMAAPEKVLLNPFVQLLVRVYGEASNQLGIGLEYVQLDSNSLLFVLSCLFIGAAVFTGLIRLALVCVSVRLTGAIGTDLGYEAYQRTLFQPYSVHVARNSHDLISCLTSKIGGTTLTLGAWITTVSSCVIILFLILTLLAINFQVTIIAGSVIGIAYGLVTMVNNQKLAANSQVIAREHNRMVKFLQEGLGGIRDILLDATQGLYCEQYRKADCLFRCANARVTVIGHSPRYIMETVGMMIFAVLALVLSQGSDGLALALPTLAALALGVQRLLPALQQAYLGWSMIQGYQESNCEVLELLSLPLPKWAHLPQPVPMLFKNEIRFDNINFTYSANGPMVFEELTFTIPKGTRVGFVGKTGSGKSTCLDLLMGLLEPTEGRILIDGTPLTPKNLRAWQRNIAHVPQAIYLSDSTLAENIAFGVPQQKIDMARVREAAQQAQIADFIESSPTGYKALVGERGIRLSGGQRQRIGIARALYKQAQVLVFDEATSALDHETEESVMKSIENLNRELTILIITHRVSTLKNCDQIIELQHGRAIQKNKAACPA